MPENGLPERVDRIERKPKARSVEAPSGQRTGQFLSLLADIVEQREYIEFAYHRLDQRMSEGFGRLDQRMTRLDERVGELDRHITDSRQQLTPGLSRLDAKLDQFISQFGPRSRGTTSRRLRPRKRRR
jgi:hypothetical protein